VLRESPRDGATNRITGSPYAYDANGNMTNDGNNTLVYDAENRVLSATNGSTSGSYTYDGNNLRVKKVSGSTATVYIFSGSKVIAEYDNGAAPSSPSREYVYSGVALLAKTDSSGTKYYHRDHLSNRLVTDSTGNTVAQMGHYPFGESWYNATNDKLLFTTYERDSESGNDYAMARSYVNGLARFSSPDPLSGSIGNPQSLNHYPYVHNDPINSVDPIGLRGHPYYFCTPGANSQFSTSCNPGGDLFGGNCAVDGIATSCGIVQSLLGAGAASACPNNICEGINQYGQPAEFHAFAGGGSGYYTFSGAGALYYDREAAMAAAALATADATNADDVVREYYSYLTEDAKDGVFSFSNLIEGEPCTQMPDGQFKCNTFFPSDVAGNVFGIAHSHPDDTPFSGTDELTYADMNSQLKRPFWGVLAPVGIPGQVLVFNPITGTECVLQGPTNSITPNRCH